MDFDQSPKTAKKVDRIQLKIPKIWCIEQKTFRYQSLFQESYLFNHAKFISILKSYETLLTLYNYYTSLLHMMHRNAYMP